MADIQATLSKKLGPLPLWGWAAAAGGLVSVLYLARRGAAQGATGGKASGQANVPYVPSPIIVTPQNMADGVSSVNPTPAPASPAGAQPMISAQSIWGQGGGVWAFASPADSSIIGIIPSGTQLQSGGSPVQGGSHSANGVTSSSWQPVKYSGTTAYLWGPEALPSTGSGGGSVMSFVPGSGGGKLLRHVGSHAHQQYMATGMGGGVQTGPWAQDPRRGLALNQGQNVVGGMGGGGHARLQAVSQRTGVPMTRLMSLNPHQWQRGRRPRGHIHIA